MKCSARTIHRNKHVIDILYAYILCHRFLYSRDTLARFILMKCAYFEILYCYVMRDKFDFICCRKLLSKTADFDLSLPCFLNLKICRSFSDFKSFSLNIT